MRLSNRLFVAVIAGALTAGACTLFTGPKGHPVTITVTSDTIAANVQQFGDVVWLQFTAPVSIHNSQKSAFSIDFCAVSVLEANGGVAWAPICAVEAATIREIAPGATETFQFQVGAAISGPGGPKWESPTVDGSYRFRLAAGAEAVVVSNEFAISALTTSAVASREQTFRTAVH